jgi:hypothetical protein
MSWSRRVVGFVLLAALAGVWAWAALRPEPGPPLPITSTSSDELPEDFAVGPMAAVAFLGEELAVAEQYSADGTRVVTITPAGGVTELPEAPGLVARDLVSDGTSIVLVGAFCRGEDCSGSLGAFRLRDDRTGWDRIDAPDIDVAEAGIETRGGVPGRPLLWSSGGMLTLDGDRVVALGSEGGAVPQSAYSCATTPAGEAPTAYNLWSRGPLSRRSLDTDDRWHRVDVEGAPPSSDGLSVLCTRDAVLAVGHLVEHRFDGETWTTGVGPDLGAVVPDRLLSWASAPDGTLYAVGIERGQVLRRSTEGVWSDTGRSARHVAVSPGGRLWLLPDPGGSIDVVDGS